MRALKKILFGSILFLGVLALGLIIWEPLSAERMAEVRYTPQDVRIARDAYGVPHIFGRSDADVAYGVAYAHAEDDFATLQEVLAMTRGRLGAMTGADGAKVDFAAQLIDGRGTVQRHYAQLPADVRALFTAYAAGLNHYAAQHPDEVRLSSLFPVRAEDVVAGFVIRSPFFFGLDNVLGRLVEGKPLHGEGGPPTPPNPATSTPAIAMASPNGVDRPYFAGTLLGGGEGQNGSNAFAVAPARGGDGQTRLVSNSHQPWTGGVAWYELVVHSAEGWDFAGATFPGSPYPFLGHNRYLGWTNTVNRPDLVDVYRLTLNADGTQYRLDGRWYPLQHQRIWLRVKWGPFVIPVPRTLYRSVHGPVVINDQGAFAIRYAGIDRLDMVTQYYRIQKARNFAEWRAAMAGQGVPATNFIYADREGNIGLFYNGLFPDRPAGYDWRHILPGDTRRDIWAASLPFARAPALVNPASGYIFNANNTPFTAAGPGDELNPAAFDPRMGVELDETNRSLRALDLFEAAGNIDDAALARIKYDTGYVQRGYAGAWIARLLALRPTDQQMRDAQALLARWDWQLDGRGDGDALALTVLRPANRVHYQRSGEPLDPAKILGDAAAHLQRHFGTLNPHLGDVLRLRHGTGRYRVDLPLDGGNDTLRASTLWDVEPDGRYRVRHGDSFLMFIRWDRQGQVHSQSIQPFGAATTRPGSPHYNDQAPLFVAHRLKPVLFEPAALWATRPRIYRP
ncbi:MAG: acylase [Sphingomonadaceae bacterium]|nr:acylase [Sphingomonadaceae bacterium]